MAKQRGQVTAVNPRARTTGTKKNTTPQRGKVQPPVVTRRVLPKPNNSPPSP
jgi:hypothetical protein